MIKTGCGLTKEEVLKKYNALGERRGLGDKFLGKVLALAGGLDGKKALDVGCGYGELLLKAARTYPDASLYGVDFTDARLAEAGTGGGISLKKVDLEDGRFPFDDNSLDVVFCTEVLEHLKRPEGCLAEIKRVLKKDGKAVFSVPNATGFFPFNRLGWHIPTRWLRSKLLPYEHPANTDQPVDTCFEYEEIIRLLESSGFVVEKTAGWRYFRYLQMLPILRSFYNFSEGFLERAMARWKMERYAYNVFLLCAPGEKKDAPAGAPGLRS